MTDANSSSKYVADTFHLYLEFDHGAEVVIPEKDTELSLLYSGCELT